MMGHIPKEVQSEIPSLAFSRKAQKNRSLKAKLSTISLSEFCWLYQLDQNPKAILNRTHGF
jgi:hypothetical protein